MIIPVVDPCHRILGYPIGFSPVVYHVFAPARDEKVKSDKSKVPRIMSRGFEVGYLEIGELGPCGVGWFSKEGQEDDKQKGPGPFSVALEAGGPLFLPVNARAVSIPILRADTITPWRWGFTPKWG